jgi:hypothetical protein
VAMAWLLLKIIGLYFFVAVMGVFFFAIGQIVGLIYCAFWIVFTILMLRMIVTKPRQ